MNSNRMNPILERSRRRWPFQHHSATGLPTFVMNLVAADVSPLHPRLAKEVRADSHRLLQFVGSLRNSLVRGSLALCLLSCLLTARGQDPWLTNTNYPINTNASLGATVSFRVFASSANPPMTIQWQHEGTNLPAATNVTLVRSNLTIADAGGYMAWVSNAIGGFTNSRTAILAVDTTFTKITQGPVVTDREPSVNGAWGDYDGDGRLDLFVANRGGTHQNTLYRNLGGDDFIRVTNALTLGGEQRSWGAAWGDVDNDDDLDILINHPFTSNGVTTRNEMFRNDGGGVFTAMSNAVTSVAANWTDATWVDHDRDGWLDLFLTTQQNVSGAPLQDFFFHNLRDGSFAAWTTNEVGVPVGVKAQTAGPAWCDIDGDGDLDLYVSYPYGGGTNFLYRNDGGRLLPVTAGSLPARRSTYAAVWADFNNDGLFDLFTGGENGTNTLHLNRGNWVFEDVTVASGLALVGTVYVSSAGDYDNDGDLDLYVSVYDGADVLYANRGDGTFDRVNVGSPLTEGFQNGATWVDYNNDGFLDLFEPCGDGTPTLNLLYRNSLKDYGNTNHWLKLRLKGTVSNASAIGARVWVRAVIGGKDTWQVREVAPACIFACPPDGMRAHFGLGDATNVDLVRIEWPSGNVQEITYLASVDRIIPVTETIRINPVRPTASLGASVSLTNVTSGLSYQWRFDGVDLVGQTNRILTLTNLTADMAGRYSVVVSNATTLATNFTYLTVDPTFFKIMTGPVVTDRANFVVGSWADYNEDGFSDLFVAAGVDVFGQAPAFYRNLGGTNFVNLTTNEVGQMVGRRPYCYQGLWADFNNDGSLDLLEIGGVQKTPTSWASSNRFFLGHSDHTFEWITGDIGVNPPQADSWQCSLVDYDNDGAVDVYYTTGWVGPPATRDALYRNRGDGTFVPAWSPTGPIRDTQFGTWADYDNDGDRDLWLGILNGLSQFYRNNGDGTFSTNLAGFGIPASTSFYGMWGDYDNDGFPDVLTKDTLFHNNRNGGFSVAATFPDGFSSWGDYDNDGDLDFVSGWVQQPCRFYRNEGGSVFTLVDLGSPSRDAYPSAPCWCDYDNNGFLDLFVATRGNPNGANFLYRNSGLAGGNSNHWLLVKPRGTTSNRSAIGAKVRVQATIRGTVTWQLREIQGGQFDDLRANFGLGNATNITTLRIEWPSGTVQELSNVTADQILTITEPRRPVLALEATPAGFTGTLKADTNQTYQVHASDDLTAGWTVLTNITTDANGTANWSDPSLSPQGRRFYKAVKAP